MTRNQFKDGLPRFNKSQLARLFGLHRQTVIHHLAGVEPCGKDKRGHNVYSIPKVSRILEKGRR